MARLKEAGVEAEGTVGDSDPICAVQETWDPGRYDEVIVSTLPVGASRWMQIDVPHRVAKLTDCTVRHIESHPREEPPPPAPPRQRRGLVESLGSLLRTATRRDAA